MSDDERPPRLNPFQHHMAALLNATAPAIEAAGNYWRAVRLGVIGGFGSAEGMSKLLLPVIPKSRGGRLEAPEAEADWLLIVAEACAQRDLDLDKMREFYDEIERNQERDRHRSRRRTSRQRRDDKRKKRR